MKDIIIPQIEEIDSKINYELDYPLRSLFHYFLDIEKALSEVVGELERLKVESAAAYDKQRDDGFFVNPETNRTAYEIKQGELNISIPFDFLVQRRKEVIQYLEEYILIRYGVEIKSIWGIT